MPRGGGDELALAREVTTRASLNAIATDLKGSPAKRSAKYGAPARRRSRSWPAQRRHRHAALPATAPRRRRSPAATSWRRPAPARRRRPGTLLARRRREAQRGGRRRGVAQPSQRWRMWNCTPAARSRCSQARSSGAAFMSFGNTRPEVPTKVSMPRPCAQSRNCCGPKRAQQRLDLRAALAEAADEDVEGLGMREVQAAAAGQQELAADRRHGVVQVRPRRRRRRALRPPSGRRGRRRSRRRSVGGCSSVDPNAASVAAYLPGSARA